MVRERPRVRRSRVRNVFRESEDLDPLERRPDLEVVIDLEVTRVGEPLDRVDPVRRDHRCLTEPVVFLLVDAENVQVVEHGRAHPRALAVHDQARFRLVVRERCLAFSMQVQLVREPDRVADLEPSVLVERLFPKDEEEERLHHGDGRGPLCHSSACERFRMLEQSRIQVSSEEL